MSVVIDINSMDAQREKRRREEKRRRGEASSLNDMTAMSTPHIYTTLHYTTLHHHLLHRLCTTSPHTYMLSAFCFLSPTRLPCLPSPSTHYTPFPLSTSFSARDSSEKGRWDASLPGVHHLVSVYGVRCM